MPKFRKKPVVIEAEQYAGNTDSGWVQGMCNNWKCPDPALPYIPGMHRAAPHVHTLEGPLLVSHGDWIIRGVKGEYYPCKPDVFEATYEPVPDEVAV
jgi:hypothetical protein